MSTRLFDITAASERIRADGDRRGEIAFTVSNCGDRKCRARFVIAAVPPASAAWFSLLGEAERDLSPDGTDQVAIIARIPASVQPGRYLMRLDVTPSEPAGAPAYEGQAVTVVVEGEAVQERTFPNWILFLVAAVIGVGGAIAALITKMFALLIAGAAAAAVVFVIALVVLVRSSRGTT